MILLIEALSFRPRRRCQKSTSATSQCGPRECGKISMALGIKPTVDFAFKRIFGSAEHALPLVGLLQAILAPDQPLTEVEILNPFSYQEFQQDKLIVLDIRARDSAGHYHLPASQGPVPGGALCASPVPAGRPGACAGTVRRGGSAHAGADEV